MAKTESISVRFDNETRYLLEQAGFIHRTTGQKVKRIGNLAAFIRTCVKKEVLKMLSQDAASVRHRLAVMDRIRLEDELHSLNARYETALERERLLRADRVKNTITQET
jgi:hypothetical protein